MSSVQSRLTNHVRGGGPPLLGKLLNYAITLYMLHSANLVQPAASAPQVQLTDGDNFPLATMFLSMDYLL